MFKRRKIDVYNIIFFTNVLRSMRAQGMTKQQLSEKSGVSISFLSDLTSGSGNPSLRIMEQLCEALGEHLPMMLEVTDLEQGDLEQLAGKRKSKKVFAPKGYEWVTALVPSFKAFEIQKLHDQSKQLLLAEKKKRAKSRAAKKALGTGLAQQDPATD